MVDGGELRDWNVLEPLFLDRVDDGSWFLSVPGLISSLILDFIFRRESCLNLITIEGVEHGLTFRPWYLPLPGLCIDSATDAVLGLNINDRNLNGCGDFVNVPMGMFSNNIEKTIIR